MKRIVAILLVLCTLLLSTFSLVSCFNFNQGQNSDNVGGGQNGTDEGVDDNNPDNGGNNGNSCSGSEHVDVDDDKYCDECNQYVIVVIDFYAVNDLHGKFCDTSSQPGVDELGTYLKNAEKTDDNVVILSSGDVWQGTAESNLTRGNLITEWMNEMNFVAMTLGNHEFDWGQDVIRNNLEIAEFPFLAINVYDNETGELADYCTPSLMIERGGIQIGIIGAIGDCYSSISSDMSEGIHFKVGSQLTSLVKAEATKLRDEGADIIVYSLHDGHDKSNSSSSGIGSSALSNYYDPTLSAGYVDVVFEAHTHQSYTMYDASGVYHLQGGGENSGISHVEIEVNSANGNNKVTEAGVVKNSEYKNLEDDPATENIEDKYSDVIDMAYSKLGIVSRSYSDSEVEDIVAELYLNAGLEKWGDEYDIVLGGGFLKTRSPYDLAAGEITYAEILSLLPFDNRLVLCSVSGNNLNSKFINSSNSDYHCYLSDYGNSIKNSISSGGTYYIVVDTYTAFYSPNGLKVIDYYDEGVYARDLFAEEVKAGRFEIKHDNYTLTSIPDALRIGEELDNNTATTEYYYIKGTITSITNTNYGNIYIVDEMGNEMYIYGLYDSLGNKYGNMPTKPVVGDTIVVCSTIYKFYYSYTTVELKNATLIEIEK